MVLNVDEQPPCWWPQDCGADGLRSWAFEVPTPAIGDPATSAQFVDRAEPQRLQRALVRLIALETRRRNVAVVTRDEQDESAEAACEDWTQDLVDRYRGQVGNESMESALETDAVGAVVDGMIIWFEFKFDDHLGIYEFHENENFIEGAMTRRQAERLPPRERPAYFERATEAWWLHLKKRDGGYQYDEPPQPEHGDCHSGTKSEPRGLVG